jgi:CBS domain-containing protein
MAIVRDVVARKGAEVVSVGMDCLILDAARMMMERRIGGVLVRDASGQVVGIFTERDVLRRVVAGQRDPAKTAVGELMTLELITVTPDTSLDECSALMTQRRIRHLPVMDDSGLRGIITSGDLLAFRVAEQEALIEDLNRYVHALR